MRALQKYMFYEENKANYKTLTNYSLLYNLP